MPKQINDHDVYDATIEMLLSYGYSGATTKLIAEAAGINEVTLFRKYGNKAELVRTAVQHETIRIDEADLQYSGNIDADLKRILNAYLSSAEQHSRLFPLIMSEMARYPELRETMHEPISAISKVGELLMKYQREGILRKEHPLHAVGSLLGPIIILTTLQTATQQLDIPPIDIDAHISAFINGRAP